MYENKITFIGESYQKFDALNELWVWAICYGKLIPMYPKDLNVAHVMVLGREKYNLAGTTVTDLTCIFEQLIAEYELGVLK